MIKILFITLLFLHTSLLGQYKYTTPFLEPFAHYVLLEYKLSPRQSTRIKKLHDHHYIAHLNPQVAKGNSLQLPSTHLESEYIVAKIDCLKKNYPAKVFETLLETYDFLIATSLSSKLLTTLCLPEAIHVLNIGKDYVFYKETKDFEEKLNLSLKYYFGKQHIDFFRKPDEEFITGDGFRALADHILDDCITTIDPRNVKEGDIVFVKSVYTDLFFATYHPLISSRYLLITHNDDNEVNETYLPYLESDTLFAWFALNVTFEHPKLHILPIGLPNRYLLPSYQLTKELRAKEGDKTICCYLNFAPGTYPKERQLLIDLLKESSFCTAKFGIPQKFYIEDVYHSMFTLAPRGNGIDTYRAWEALYLGSIPIIKCNPAMKTLYENFPVLFVEEWQEINEDFLLEQYQKILAKNYPQEKLFMNYWKELISSYKKMLVPTF